MGMELQNGNSVTAQNKIQTDHDEDIETEIGKQITKTVQKHIQRTPCRKRLKMSPRWLDVSRMAETERKSGKEGFFTPLYFT